MGSTGHFIRRRLRGNDGNQLENPFHSKFPCSCSLVLDSCFGRGIEVAIYWDVWRQKSLVWYYGVGFFGLIIKGESTLHAERTIWFQFIEGCNTDSESTLTSGNNNL